jgi:hypothetical protein
MPTRRRDSLLTYGLSRAAARDPSARDAVTLSLVGTSGIAPDLGRSWAVGCLDRRYRVYRFHQLVREGASISMYFLAYRAAVLWTLSENPPGSQRPLRCDARCEAFRVLIRADKRLSGHLRDPASESLGGFDCRGHSRDRAIDARVGCLRALFRHDFPPPQNVLPDMAKLNDLK